MNRYLLDVNILLALFWEDHQSHDLVLGWFKETGKHSFATCGITQSGFVRLSANPQYSNKAVSVPEGIEILSTITDLPGHTFWPVDIGIREATARFVRGLYGHRQVTDAYLLGLAIHHDGKLVTLDRGFHLLAGAASSEHVLQLE